MDGRRFGIGMVVGILLGLGVVAASGGLNSAAPLFAPHGTALFTAATTATTTAYNSVSTAPANGTEGYVSNVSTGTGAGLSPVTPQASMGSILNALPSSNLAAFASQSPGSNAFLMVPVLLALALGAVVYRTSSRGGTASGKEEG